MEGGANASVLPTHWQRAQNQRIGTFEERDGRAIFLLLEVTSDARRNGYSVLKDPQRGPATFGKYEDWSDCEPGSLTKALVLTSTPNAKTVYAECRVMVRQGVVGLLSKASVYSAGFLLQVSVIGSQSSVLEFKEALQHHEQKLGT